MQRSYDVFFYSLKAGYQLRARLKQIHILPTVLRSGGSGKITYAIMESGFHLCFYEVGQMIDYRMLYFFGG